MIKARLTPFQLRALARALWVLEADTPAAKRVIKNARAALARAERSCEQVELTKSQAEVLIRAAKISADALRSRTAGGSGVVSLDAARVTLGIPSARVLRRSATLLRFTLSFVTFPAGHAAAGACAGPGRRDSG